MTFNDLTVLARAGSTKFGEARWLCRCTCGTEVHCAGSVLRRGTKKSCGCLWRTTFEETRICSSCKLEKPHQEFYRNRNGTLEAQCRYCKQHYFAAFYREHPEFHSARAARVKAERVALRERVLAAYGGKCACCGEDEPIFLAIDHKNGGGSKHREQFRTSEQFYKWLEANGYPSDEYQCLCANCNWGKHANGGTCPHKRRVQ
jgi:hypothetical protein